jgi:hypothetical protein
MTCDEFASSKLYDSAAANPAQGRTFRLPGVPEGFGIPVVEGAGRPEGPLVTTELEVDEDELVLDVVDEELVLDVIAIELVLDVIAIELVLDVVDEELVLDAVDEELVLDVIAIELVLDVVDEEPVLDAVGVEVADDEPVLDALVVDVDDDDEPVEASAGSDVASGVAATAASSAPPATYVGSVLGSGITLEPHDPVSGWQLPPFGQVDIGSPSAPIVTFCPRHFSDSTR